MADESWPSSFLPSSPLLGHTEAAPKTRLVSDMDDGPPKVRPKTSRAVRPVTISFYLNGDSVADDLMEFYEDTLDGGTRTFDGLALPRTGDTTVVWLFAEEPSIELVEPPGLWHVMLRLWQL